MNQTRGERVTQVWDDPKLWIHEEDIGGIVKARFYEARSSGKWLYGFEISYTDDRFEYFDSKEAARAAMLVAIKEVFKGELNALFWTD